MKRKMHIFTVMLLIALMPFTAFAQVSTNKLFNRTTSSTPVPLGSAVIMKTDEDFGFKVSTVSSDIGVIGVTREIIAKDARGIVAFSGLVPVLVENSVASGDHLALGTGGRAVSIGTSALGAFAIAVEDGNGTSTPVLVNALLLPTTFSGDIDALSGIDTTGWSTGALVKFNSDGELVPAANSEVDSRLYNPRVSGAIDSRTDAGILDVEDGDGDDWMKMQFSGTALDTMFYQPSTVPVLLNKTRLDASGFDLTTGIYKIAGVQIDSEDLSDTANVAMLNQAETIAGNWVNTANPWGLDEIVSTVATDAEVAAAYQPLDADLTYLAGVTPTANVKSVLNAADYAAIQALLSLVVGTNVQAQSAKLQAIHDLTSSAGVLYNNGSGVFSYETSTPPSFANQVMNTVLAGPTSGANAAPAFRALVAADIPSLSSTYQPLDADLTYLAGFTPTANVKTILNAADYAAIKTAMTLTPGTDIQAYDADLAYLAGFTPTANVKSVLNAADYAAIRTLLGLVISTNVQAYDADLTTYAGITPAANVQSVLGAADYAAIRTLLGLVISTNVQAYDADLADLADGVYAGTFDFDGVNLSGTNPNILATTVENLSVRVPTSKTGTFRAGTTDVATFDDGASGGRLYPATNSVTDLGLSGNRWEKLWAVSADISGDSALAASGTNGVKFTRTSTQYLQVIANSTANYITSAHLGTSQKQLILASVNDGSTPAGGLGGMLFQVGAASAPTDALYIGSDGSLYMYGAFVLSPDALTANATQTWSSASSNFSTVTIGAANITIQADSNATPRDAQRHTFRIRQNATTPRTVTFTTGSSNSFNFGASSAPSMTATVDKFDYFSFCYNDVTDRWDYQGSLGGY